MKKPDIKRDGDSFYADTSAGRLRAEEVGGLEKLAQKIEENRPRPDEFLVAWKDGIRLAGEHLFRIQSDTIESATDKDQLRPDLEVITTSLGGFSSTERIFILSLYQFFSDSTVRDLCTEHGYDFPTLTDIASLDREYRTVVSQLINTYSGW